MKSRSPLLKASLCVGCILTMPRLIGSFAVAQICVQPPEGLVSWWPGEGDAADIADENDGTLQNGATFAPGMVGQAFSLDGVDDHVRIPAASNLNVQSFTIDAWIFPTDLSVSQPIIEYAAETGWAGVHLWLNVPLRRRGGCSGLQANVRDTSDFGPDGSHELASPPGVVIADQWNHAALTYEKQTGIARLYANGTIVAESHLGTTFTPQTSLPLLFGSRPGGSFDGLAGRYFAGLIDEVSSTTAPSPPQKSRLSLMPAAPASAKGFPSLPWRHRPPSRSAPRRPRIRLTCRPPLSWAMAAMALTRSPTWSSSRWAPLPSPFQRIPSTVLPKGSLRLPGCLRGLPCTLPSPPHPRELRGRGAR